MGYFPHAFQKLLLAVNGFYKTPAHVINMESQGGKVAVIDAKTHQINAMTSSNGEPFYLAQGTLHTNDKIGPFHGGYKESVKTKVINPRYISKFYYTAPAAPVNQIVRVCASSCNLACDTTYNLRVDVKGSPALRFLTHNAYLTVGGYTGCCDANSSNIDPNVVLLQWMDGINNSPILSKFVTATVWNDIEAAVGTPITGEASADAFLTVSDRTGILAGQRVTFIPSTATSATGSTIADNVFTVGTATNTIFSVGQTITGTGVTAGTIITELLTGGGGTGSTFRVNKSQTVASTTISSVTAVTAFVASSYVAATGAGDVALVAATTLNTPSTTAISVVTTTAGTAMTVSGSITTAGYTVLTGAAADTVASCLEIVGTYADTVFGDCSFSQRDFFETEPVLVYTSAVDESGDPCLTSCFTHTIVQDAVYGKGYGETLIRELILFNRYRQEPFNSDPRMREVEEDTVLSSITRSSRYGAYYILHSIPRKSNPSGTLDSDQYLVKVAVTGRDGITTTSGTFEYYITQALTAVTADGEVALELL